MKKLFVIFVLFLLGNMAFAIDGTWIFPKNIRTYIPQNNKDTIMMEHAFERWTKLTNGRILFKYVNNQNAAQINVEFVDKIPTSVNGQSFDKAIGLTKTTYTTNKKLVNATIYIAKKTQDNKELNRDEIFTTMLHEIGHAIGLNHNNNKNSVMYPGVNVTLEIDAEDLKVLKRLYKW